ncbi:MAG: tyrosine-type recombinase/integrase, partial [Sulfuricurvum sp.]|nr:tyrosine-type recombinase/integrase [Sulfuricurvum sp.]
SKSLHGSTGFQEPDFKRAEAEADNIYLTVDELIKLHSAVITEALILEEYPDLKGKLIDLKIKALHLARCKFLVGAFTALRVSDFKRIEEINISDNRIRIRTVKGDKGVVIPVHWVIKELLNNGFDMSTKISEQKINKHIKRICKYAGIITPISLSKFEKGKRITVAKPKCDWVTTHTARRSGATNMFIAGIPSISIMKITGHRTEKSFMKYIKISQEENAELLSDHAFFKKEVKKIPQPTRDQGIKTNPSKL